MKLKDYNEDFFAERTPGQLFWHFGWRIGAAIVAIALTVTCVGLPLGWFNKAADVVSPQNVEAQYRAAYDNMEAMEAAATQWCSFKHAEDDATDPTVKEQRASQRLAVETNFPRIRALYNAAMEDAFRAKYVKPLDLPDDAPTLDQVVARLGCYP